MDVALNDGLDVLQSAARSVGAEVSSPWFYFQVGVVMLGAGIAFGAGAAIRSRVDMATVGANWPAPFRVIVRVLCAYSSTVVFAVLMQLARFIMREVTWPSRSYLLAVFAKLALAWLAIRLMTSVIRNEFILRLVSISAWLVAALSIIGQLDPVIEALDSVSIMFGGLRLTPLLLIQLAVLLAAALWLSNVASNFAESRIAQSGDLTPSVQVLLVKLIRLGLMVFAIAVAMSAVGINLSALAIFSGAAGVGIGFGLQKIVANFISGIILLVDKSVKPGDLVTIGDSSGRISAMKTRYISVAAGDGREFLIPNEDLVTQKVTNWTYTDKNTLVKVNFGAEIQAAELPAHRFRRGRHEVLPDLLGRRPFRHGQHEERGHAVAVGCLQARGHPRPLSRARTPRAWRRAAGGEHRGGSRLELDPEKLTGFPKKIMLKQQAMGLRGTGVGTSISLGTSPGLRSRP